MANFIQFRREKIWLVLIEGPHAHKHGDIVTVHKKQGDTKDVMLLGKVGRVAGGELWAFQYEERRRTPEPRDFKYWYIHDTHGYRYRSPPPTGGPASPEPPPYAEQMADEIDRSPEWRNPKR